MFLPLSTRPLILRKLQSLKSDQRSHPHSWRYFQRGLNWCLGLKREARMVKGCFSGLTRVKTFLLLTIQPCAWLAALQEQLIRGRAVDTTFFSTKHSKADQSDETLGLSFLWQHRNTSQHTMMLFLKKFKTCRPLTFNGELLRSFQCWVINQRAFVFTRGIPWDISDGVRISIFHLDHLSL